MVQTGTMRSGTAGQLDKGIVALGAALAMVLMVSAALAQGEDEAAQRARDDSLTEANVRWHFEHSFRAPCTIADLQPQFGRHRVIHCSNGRSYVAQQRTGRPPEFQRIPDK
jgi:hypothetical protein